MRARAPAPLIALVALAALAACSKAGPQPDPMDPVTPDEAKAFAASFQAAVTPCAPDRVIAMIDSENLIKRAVAHSKLSAGMREGIARGMRKGASLGSLFCGELGDDVSYVLLRIKNADGQPRPLFRLIADGAVNYHELELGKSKRDHVIRIVDLRVYASGDMLSDSLTQMIDQAAVMLKRGADPSSMQRVSADIKAARARGDNAEARRLVGTYPPELRATKPVRLMEVMMGSDLDDPAYAEVMERYRRDFPADPSVEVASIDYYYLKKDMPKALAALDHLDQLVGGDPYLDVMRANTYQLDSEPAHLVEAERFARKATTADPSLENGWWALAGALLRRGDHAAVVTVADVLRTRFHATIDEDTFADDELWAPYFASAAYRAWAKAQPAITPPPAAGEPDPTERAPDDEIE